MNDLLLYLGQLKGRDVKTLDAAIDHWLALFDLSEWKERKVEELSKGMAQKVQFISSVIHDPDIIILDEPFSGLDPVSTDRMRELIMDLSAQGRTILFSTHIMEQAKSSATPSSCSTRGRLFSTVRFRRSGNLPVRTLLSSSSAETLRLSVNCLRSRR